MIFGPTAVGKSDVLSKLFDSQFEIVNADSRQVYRFMDIGTAKPARGLIERLTHHLIDVVEPCFQFNAGEFVKRTEVLIPGIFARGRFPVVCGGTAFYLKSFLFGLPGSPPSNPKLRMELKWQAKEWGMSRLFAELKRVDPVSAARIPEHDGYRIIRALEVYRWSGKPLSSFLPPQILRDDYRFLIIGLNRERQELYTMIDDRVDRMFNSGLVREVKSLLERGYDWEDPGMKGIGYREFSWMQAGCLTLAGAKDLIKRNSRRLAKRQLTFFKAIRGVRWFHPGDLTGIGRCIEEFLDVSLSQPDRWIAPLDATDHPST